MNATENKLNFHVLVWNPIYLSKQQFSHRQAAQLCNIFKPTVSHLRRSTMTGWVSNNKKKEEADIYILNETCAQRMMRMKLKMDQATVEKIYWVTSIITKGAAQRQLYWAARNKKKLQTQGLGESDENRYARRFIFLAMRLKAHTAFCLIEADLFQFGANLLHQVWLTKACLDLKQANIQNYFWNTHVFLWAFLVRRWDKVISHMHYSRYDRGIEVWLQAL